MRRFHTTIVLALATLLSVYICPAQQAATTSVPNLIRYSGTLKDAQGTALSSNVPVGVTFAIYNQQDGGAAVWMETQNVRSDSNGQYNVILGGTTATGLPDDLFSQQEQRWLGVQVQGQDEQPRILLVSVPYAFKAHEAETLGGLPASAFVKALPTDASRSASADVGTSINALRGASGIVSLAGSPPPPLGLVFNSPCPAGIVPSPNFVPIWFRPAVNSNVICDSVIFQTPIGAAGNVGIGTTTPAAKLEVNGNINLTGASQTYQIGGYDVLAVSNTNVFVGDLAGSGGGYNTAVGHGAGETDGDFNVSIGNQSNQGGSGNDNTLVGANTAMVGLFGSENTIVGSGAGFNLEHGNHDIFIGYNTGSSGSLLNDIYLDARCNPSTCDEDHPENNTTRIGTQGRQADTYIAGIYGSIATPAAGDLVVCVKSTGELYGGAYLTDCTSSSQRFKENILDMGDSSSKLFQLRPVTFFYKPQYDDGSRFQQYGLIAEEVAKVLPEMAAYDKDGRPYAVRYQMLTPMLLNELQKQHAVVAAQQQQIEQLQQRLLRLETLIGQPTQAQGQN